MTFSIHEDAERDVQTFCSGLQFTGSRISELLALTSAAFDYAGKAIILETASTVQYRCPAPA